MLQGYHYIRALKSAHLEDKFHLTQLNEKTTVKPYEQNRESSP